MSPSISLRKTFYAFFSILLFGASLVVAIPAFATSTTVSTQSELTSAIASASTGDTIQLASDLVVTGVISVSKEITIDGSGYSISVPQPGVTDAGANNASASTFGVFSLSGSYIITLTDMTIKGGNTQGAGVKVGSGTTAVLDGVTISNSRYASGGGAGIYNGGTTLLKNSNLMRNSARYGGGFLNPGGKTMYVVNSTVTDNRSESAAGGGGGAENQGTLYINNSTFANNSSTEIGGAVNNYRGTLYVSGSSFTGNVAFGSYGGGALGNNGGTIKVASSLFAYNYSRSSGTVTSPTAFDLDDVGITSRSITTGSGVTLYYSIYHASNTAATINSTNTAYTQAADGTGNSLFTGGSVEKIRDGSGLEIGTASVYKPLIAAKNGRFAAALGLSSDAAQKGTPVRFDIATGQTSYYDRLAATPAWANLTSLAGSTDVVADQYGEARNSTMPAVGAVEIEQSNLYQVRAVSTSGGTVRGASIYGDVYSANTVVTVTAVPNSGMSFDHFTVTTTATSLNSAIFAAVIPISTNPLVYKVTADAVVTPVFVSAPAGERTVTYAANGATCGLPASSSTSTTDITIAGNTSTAPLQREGYVFSGWNTEPNASGTDYAVGATYTSSTNLNLSAKWVPSSGVTTTCFASTVSTPTPTPSASSIVAPPEPTSSPAAAATSNTPVVPRATIQSAPAPTPTPSASEIPTLAPSSDQPQTLLPQEATASDQSGQSPVVVWLLVGGGIVATGVFAFGAVKVLIRFR